MKNFEDRNSSNKDSIIKEIGFIVGRILSRTITFGTGLSAVLTVISIGFLNASLKSCIATIPYIFIISFFATMVQACSKEFWLVDRQDQGLSDRGYHPKTNERQLTKEEWKKKHREERKKRKKIK